MAKLHQGSKHLKKNAHQARNRAILWTLPTIIYIVLYFTQQFQLHWGFHLLALLPLIVAARYSRQYKIYRAGIEGEVETAKFLKSLPASYEIYRSVPVSYQGQKSEIDLVIVGENGVFAVEVKNHSGKLSGSADAQEWQQVKRGPKGEQTRKMVRNPILQMKNQVWLLSQNMKEQKLSLWIEGIVYIANPNCELNIKQVHVPFFNQPEQLSRYILHYQAKNTPTQAQLTQVKKLLHRLSKSKN
ncbi:nuclease-related domain-containing protein [Rubeoparvulum massiliense]|uniref:nuclease-related domain-containing protein n=1 Tax=Rubeoparvulum massiliense TaxID=1631346 RepID=UPI00065E4046|nr:nuclease-related domain-containing protein [Rubeoparvulum massiliense]